MQNLFKVIDIGTSENWQLNYYGIVFCTEQCFLVSLVRCFFQSINVFLNLQKSLRFLKFSDHGIVPSRKLEISFGDLGENFVLFGQFQSAFCNPE